MTTVLHTGPQVESTTYAGDVHGNIPALGAATLLECVAAGNMLGLGEAGRSAAHLRVVALRAAEALENPGVGPITRDHMVAVARQLREAAA